MIQYRELLRKYVEYVENCEGTNFIDSCEGRHTADVKFSEREWQELETIAQEVKKIRTAQRETAA